jgi:hypothetical protein
MCEKGRRHGLLQQWIDNVDIGPFEIGKGTATIRNGPVQSHGRGKGDCTIGVGGVGILRIVARTITIVQCDQRSEAIGSTTSTQRNYLMGVVFDPRRPPFLI